LQPNGQQAVATLDSQHYDIVLLGVHLPRLSGYEVLESHEGRSLLQTIPVIMIIVGRRPDSVARCIDLVGRMSYLLEPISHEMLDLRIHITMQKHANREEQALHISGSRSWLQHGKT